MGSCPSLSADMSLGETGIKGEGDRKRGWKQVIGGEKGKERRIQKGALGRALGDWARYPDWLGPS